MLKGFKAQQKRRIARQEERREEVQGMLGDFKKERIGAAKDWRAMQEKIAKKKKGSLQGS